MRVKLVGGSVYVEKYGKYYLVPIGVSLGNRPALQFYNEAITTAPESKAAREAESKVAWNFVAAMIRPIFYFWLLIPFIYIFLMDADIKVTRS